MEVSALGQEGPVGCLHVLLHSPRTPLPACLAGRLTSTIGIRQVMIMVAQPFLLHVTMKSNSVPLIDSGAREDRSSRGLVVL